MKKHIIIESVVGGIIRIIPWRVRPLVYKWPGLSSRIRNILNRLYLPGTPRVFTITAGPLKGRRLDLNIRYDKSFWLATHEPQVQNALKKMVRPGSVAYDIGSYIGYYTLLLSVLCGEKGKVVACEPHPVNFEKLTRNVSLNRLHNVETLNIALSDEKGQRPFEEGSTPAQGSLIYALREDEPARPRRRLLSIEVSTLDEIVFSRGYPPPGNAENRRGRE